jgi:hypothetical protein
MNCARLKILIKNLLIVVLVLMLNSPYHLGQINEPLLANNSVQIQV